jgi:hypothetical protein
MTKPSLSWIDPQDLQRLLARVSSPEPAPRAAEAPVPLSSRASRTRTLPPPMLPAPSLVDPDSSAGRLPEFSPPPGGLEERLQAFLSWVNLGVGPLTAFVADESGLPLASLADDELVAVTAPCMATFKHLGTLSGGEARGRMTLVVDQDRQLHVAEASCPWGRFNVAILTQTGIPDTTMKILQRGLVAALAEPGEEG